MEIVGLTETHLRGLIKWEGDTYNRMEKGREKTQKKEGGVAIMIRNNSGWETEQVKVSEGNEMEDVMAVKLERRNEGREENILLIIAYFTVEGGQQEQEENQRKYRDIGDLINGRKEEEIILMGDMNAHIGLLGEK